MTNVTEDEKISKLILKFGNGNMVPLKSVVYFHYNSYLEMEEIPFDSSYLRNEKPLRMQLGLGDLYVGFEKSLLTMREGEKSQFLVHPDYAFGKLGAPPRIPPNATILLEIELIKIVDCSGIDRSDELPGENSAFSEIYSKAKGYQILGNDFFGQGNISAAIDKYKKAEKVLLTSKTSNFEEENQFKELLLKLYINLCVCYNHPKIKSPEKVCTAAKNAFYGCTEGAGKSAKLFFNLGKAFIELNEFDKAGKNLKKALSLEPQNKNTNDLLAVLEEKKKVYYQHEKLACQKLFSYQSIKPKEQEIKPESEFEKLLKTQLKEFSENSTNKIQLPAGLTYNERHLCRKLCEELRLNYEENLIAGILNISITK